MGIRVKAGFLKLGKDSERAYFSNSGKACEDKGVKETHVPFCAAQEF